MLLPSFASRPGAAAGARQAVRRCFSHGIDHHSGRSEAQRTAVQHRMGKYPKRHQFGMHMFPRSQLDARHLDLVYPSHRPRHDHAGGHFVHVPRAELNDGNAMPMMGLGTWRLGMPEVRPAVNAALRAGYLHFDCSPLHRNESAVGEVIERFLLDEQVVPADRRQHRPPEPISRDDLFVVSKLWNTHHHPDMVRRAALQSIQDLRCQYLDLFLIQWPVAFQYDPKAADPLFPRTPKGGLKLDTAITLHDTWRAMQDLVVDGLVRSIGVANFSQHKLQELLKHSKVVPAVNQIELHPYYHQRDLIEYCREHGIQVVAHSPLGGPMVTDPAVNSDGHLPNPRQDPLVAEIARRVGRSPAQVLLRYALQNGFCVVAKSAQPRHVRDNLDVFDFELRPEDMARLGSIKADVRLVRPQWLG